MSTEAPVVEAPVVVETPVSEGAKPDAQELGEGGVSALKSEREARKAAEKAASDLAAELKAIKDKDKSEGERQQEALEAARAELAELTTAKTRAEVAATKAVPATLLAGPASSSEADLAKFADALIAFRGEKGSTRLTIPNEGKSPAKAGNTDEREFAKTLFRKAD